MVLKAHLGPLIQSSADSDSRRTQRRDLLLQTSAALETGAVAAEANVTVHNISSAGMLIETGLPLAIGERVAVGLPQAGVAEATIVWVSARLFGCEFTRSLSDSDLAAVQLKAEFALPASRDVTGAGAAARTEALGPRLNRLRRERGLTLADVAGRLGVSKPTVWAWEKGKAKPLPERYEAIAQTLGVELVEITDVAPSGDALPVIEESRLRIAQIYGVHPDRVRIMIDL